MKILILAYGSRGDLQPLLALGVGLRHAGHRVCLAAPQNYAGAILRQGLEVAVLPGDPTILMGAMTAQASSRLQRAATIVRHFIPLVSRLIECARSASQDADLILHSLWTSSVGRWAAQQRGIPDLNVSLFPLLSPTGAFPAIPWSALSFGSAGNRLTHQLVAQAFWQGSRLVWAAARHANPQLPAWNAQIVGNDSMPILYAFSPLVVPRPPDWSASVHLTGYWFLEQSAGWYSRAELANFLARYPLPLVVGFGSMVVPPALSARILAGLVHTGLPVIWLTGWSQPPTVRLPAQMIAIPEVPHDWLFPQALAIVCHGGAGTVAAALRAGVPIVTLPFMADQYFWGQQSAVIGAGPPPLSVLNLTAERLAHAVQQANRDQMRQQAALVGAGLRAETGVAQAITFIEQAGSS